MLLLIEVNSSADSSLEALLFRLLRGAGAFAVLTPVYGESNLFVEARIFGSLTSKLQVGREVRQFLKNRLCKHPPHFASRRLRLVRAETAALEMAVRRPEHN